MTRSDVDDPRRGKGLLGLVAVTALASVGLAACGSSDSSSGAGPSGKDAACSTEASSLTKAALASSSQNPYPADAVDGSQAKGKTYWIIALSTSIPSVASYVEGFQAAAGAAGASVQVFDGQATPTKMAQGVSNAVAANADGIALAATGVAPIAEAVKQAGAAGIPVIDGFNGDPTQSLAEGVTGQTAASNPTLGKMQADYALQLTRCDLQAITVASLSVSSSKLGADATQAEISRLCSSCKNTVVDIPPADIPTKLVGMMQTTLQRNPGANAIMAASDAYVPYILQAEKALNVDTPIIGNNGDQVKVGMDGGTIVAEGLYPPPVVVGWYMFDAMLRATDGQTGFSTTMPFTIVDKSNWGTDPDPFALQPRYTSYEDDFKKLWGLS
jgi:ribose transport system substrate-binding protein